MNINYQDLVKELNNVGWHTWHSSVQSGAQWSVIEFYCLADGRVRTVFTVIDDGNYRIGDCFSTLNIRERELISKFINQDARQCFAYKPSSAPMLHDENYIIR